MNKIIISTILGLTFGIFAVANAAQIVSVSTSADSVIKTGSNQTVSWRTSDFPENGKVNVNLIRKVTDSPASYVLVRQISSNTDNDGTEAWEANRHEVGENLLIEVTCADMRAFGNGCVANTDNKIFAVKAGFSANIANVWESFINLFR